MSFGKFFKKVFKITNPLESKIFGLDKKKKSGPVSTEETPAQLEARLTAEQHSYANAPADALAGAQDRAKQAGTYSDSAAFQTALQAEAGAAARQNQYTSLQRQNAILSKLGRPTLPVGTTPAAPGTTPPTAASPTTAAKANPQAPPPAPVYNPNSNSGVISQ